jgi:cell division protein FtsB
METQYAVMKFRTWNFLQAYQASALSQGALMNRANGLTQVVNRLRAENEELKEQVRKLEAQNAAFQVERISSEPDDSVEAAAPSPHPDTPLQRLIQRISRSQG